MFHVSLRARATVPETPVYLYPGRCHHAITHGEGNSELIVSSPFARKMSTKTIMSSYKLRLRRKYFIREVTSATIVFVCHDWIYKRH